VPTPGPLDLSLAVTLPPGNYARRDAIDDVAMTQASMDQPDSATTTRRRVLVWYWGRRGGGSQYTLEILRGLAQTDRFDLHCSLSTQNQQLAAFGDLAARACLVQTYGGVVDFVLRPHRAAIACRRLHGYLRRQRIDVVISTMPHLWTVPALWGLRGTGVRFVSVIHDAAPHPGEPATLARRRTRAEIAAADCVVALSDHVADELRRRYGDVLRRAVTIPHVAIPLAAAAARPRTHPAGRPFRLMLFGRMLAYKGIDRLLDAYALALGRGLDVTLALVGEGDLSAHRGSLARLPGITLVNRWIPEREIPAILAGADAVILPYGEASQSGVIPVAAPLGLPAIVTPVGGLAEQVAHERTGLVAAGLSAADLAGCIERLVVDGALYERCSAGCLDLARTTLDPATIGRRFAALVDELPAGR
jgi:glycosyltransferase involved in cell wall biosynthesis